MLFDISQKMNPVSTLLIQHSRILPSSLIGPFIEECNRLSVPFEAHESEPELYASAEDYIPTAIAVYLAKPFIDAFLKKAGEDAYILFKKSLAALISRAREIRMTVITSGNKKSDPNYPFSRVVSVYSTSVYECRIKFLFPHSLTDADYEVAIDTLVTMIDDTSVLPPGRRMGHLILMEFSSSTKSWIERSTIMKNG